MIAFAPTYAEWIHLRVAARIGQIAYSVHHEIRLTVGNTLAGGRASSPSTRAAIEAAPGVARA